MFEVKKDSAYWIRTISNELTAAEKATDDQYVSEYVKVELGLHEGRDWENSTPTELKADFKRFVNFITPN